ncbi:MAG: Na+/H+ antiporter NhaC family protein [Clostridia bacterium]
MVTAPSLWGLVPLLVFIVLVFKQWNPIAAIVTSLIVGAIMGGVPLQEIASSIQGGMGSFIAYVGLIIMAGGGLGKVAERTGAARKIVRFIVYRIGVTSPAKAIVGTMIASALLVALLGTLAGANAVIAPVVIPIVAAAGLSSSVVAVIFQGAGATGLFLGPFTPPMVTLMGLTGLTYPQVLLGAGLPVSIVMWIVTYIYCKRILPTSIKEHPYSDEAVAVLSENAEPKSDREESIAAQATAAFIISLLGFIAYGIMIEGGATFAIFVILATAIVTGLVGRLHPSDLAETFVEGAKPLTWLFIQFVLFSPFIKFIEDMGAFEAVKNLLMPLIETGGSGLLVFMASVIGVVGVPGAAVAQKVVLHEMFSGVVETLGVSMNVWVLVLLVGSQITSFLYPTGDTLGAMGLARSDDLKNMIIYGVVATIPVLLYVAVRAFLLPV